LTLRLDVWVKANILLSEKMERVTGIGFFRLGKCPRTLLSHRLSPVLVRERFDEKWKKAESFE
jgi:hypothetical protein